MNTTHSEWVAPKESTVERTDFWKQQVNVEIGKLDTSNDALRAQLQTLQGRIESLERRIEKMTEREQAVRRAVGQLAHACDVIRK